LGQGAMSEDRTDGGIYESKHHPVDRVSGAKRMMERERKWQQVLAERSQALFLVRGLLGCACPDEIFDHYQVRQDVMEGFRVVELIMGERLIVWIIAGDRVADPGPTLEGLLQSGFKERERRGLNRFRLVVVGDHPFWEKEWGHLALGLDPKVHLHILPEIDTPVPNPGS